MGWENLFLGPYHYVCFEERLFFLIMKKYMPKKSKVDLFFNIVFSCSISNKYVFDYVFCFSFPYANNFNLLTIQ